MKTIRVGRLLIGGGAPLVLIAGPCVIEDEEKTVEIARYLKELTGKLGDPVHLQGLLRQGEPDLPGCLPGTGSDPGA